MSTELVTAEVQRIITELSRPLTEEDLRMGWNPELQRIWRDIFAGVKAKLDQKIPFKASEVNMAYGLATHGVEGGALALRVATVGSILMQAADNRR